MRAWPAPPLSDGGESRAVVLDREIQLPHPGGTIWEEASASNAKLGFLVSGLLPRHVAEWSRAGSSLFIVGFGVGGRYYSYPTVADWPSRSRLPQPCWRRRVFPATPHQRASPTRQVPKLRRVPEVDGSCIVRSALAKPETPSEASPASAIHGTRTPR